MPIRALQLVLRYYSPTQSLLTTLTLFTKQSSSIYTSMEMVTMEVSHPTKGNSADLSIAML